MSKEKITLSVEETANIIGVSKAFVYKLVSRGELPAMRLGRRILFPRKKLMEFIEGDLLKLMAEDNDFD